MPNKDYVYTESERAINKVIEHQDHQLASIQSTISDNLHRAEDATKSAEQTLASCGISLDPLHSKTKIHSSPMERKSIVVRSWEEIQIEAEQHIPYDVSIKSLFTESELNSSEAYLIKLREEFNALHRLDAIDYTICGISGVLSAAVDIFLVGMPASPLAGIKGGSLSNYIRKIIDEALPPNEIKKLEKNFWVPYDPANNANLKIPVEGLSSYFHRFQSLGHDPILGFIFGVLDVMNGTFTAIDVNGNFIKQAVSNHGTIGMKLFDAINLVLGHMKSDISTPRGLPAPFMTLLNLFQFGEIGDEGLSISEIARSMYAQGYDFRHFISMSIPVALNEVIARSAYCVKRVKEGNGLIQSLPFDSPMSRKPKLSTMLFISHSIATAANAGKIAFTEDPLAINYAQWLAFAKYTISQLKWVLVQKPALRDRYVQGFLDQEWKEIDNVMQDTWNEFTRDAIILYK